MPTLTHKIEGDKKVLSFIERMGSKSSLAALMDEIGSYGVSSTQQRFLDEEDPDGNKWKKSRRAQETGGATLRKDNHLFQSLSHHASSTGAEWGSNKIYAAIQHWGGIIKPKSKKALRFVIGGQVFFSKRVKIPSRRYLGISAGDRAEINAIINDHYTSEVRP